MAAFVAAIGRQFLGRHIKKTMSVRVLSAEGPKSKRFSAPKLTLITSYLSNEVAENAINIFVLPRIFYFLILLKCQAKLRESFQWLN